MSSKNENGIRTNVSEYWGRMQLPDMIKMILKAQFYTRHVLIVDANHNYYGVGQNDHQ